MPSYTQELFLFFFQLSLPSTSIASLRAFGSALTNLQYRRQSLHSLAIRPYYAPLAKRQHHRAEPEKIERVLATAERVREGG